MADFKEAPEPVVVRTKELEEAMEHYDKLLELRLKHCPLEWRGPLIDVFDTFTNCGYKLMASQGFVTAHDAIQLTRLVMDRKARLEDLAERERQREESSAPLTEELDKHA